MIDALFIVANFILLCGTLLLIGAVIKNRNILDGYSMIGAVLTVIPIGMFLVCYVLMENWFAFAFGLVTFGYWILVVVFKLWSVLKHGHGSSED